MAYPVVRIAEPRLAGVVGKAQGTSQGGKPYDRATAPGGSPPSLRSMRLFGRLALVIAVSGVTAAPGIGAQLDTLPDLGDHSTTIISAAEEEQLGRTFMRNARQQLAFIDDPELKSYLNDVGQRLAVHSESPGQTFHFYLIKHPALNAFAVPGGHISVHTGLILAAEDESELAAVMAHELAHITQRHMPRMLDQAKNQSLPTLAAVVAAILLGGPAASAALAATNAALIESQLRYSRAFEREADSIGIQALARAGYDPRSMTRFFLRMEQWGRIHDSAAPEFLRTHPLTSTRVAESQARAESYPQPPERSSSDFYHVRAKIRALYTDRPDYAVRTFAANLREHRYPDAAAERYGYALALMDIGEYEVARDVISRLIGHDPQNTRYRIAQAEIEMAAGQYQTALQYFYEARQLNRDNRALDMYYANALIQTGRFAEAKPLLREAIRRDTAEPRLYQMLARAEGEDGNSLGAHQALTEYHYLRGEFNEALRQLYLAKRYTGDSQYAVASVNARITEIQQEMQQRGEKPVKDKAE